MANWCAIGMTLTLGNEETAKKLYNSLVNAKDGRDLDFHGDKILYGAEIRLSSHSNDIGIQADVSSALEREDMIHFVKWLRQFVPATQLTASVDYSEFSWSIFGKYELRNELLKDYYLQGKEIPDTPDCENEEAYSAYCDEINARIDAKEGELIYDFNADEKPDLAFLISPVADMENLITGMMAAEGVTESELRRRGVIPVRHGGRLSWEYLCYARCNPLYWDAPTHILYGENDALVPFSSVAELARRTGAELTVMPGGGHWFHTPEQMRFLDEWIKNGLV